MQPREHCGMGPGTGPTDRRLKSLNDLPSIWQLSAPVEWLVEGIFPLGSVNLLCSESGTGKTWVADAIAGAVAHGVPFLGFKTLQRPVIYLDGENPLAIVKRNMQELGVVEHEGLKFWGGWNECSPPGPDEKLLMEFAREQRGLMIWDPLVEFHPGDEQSSTETRAFMKKFRRLAHHGATVLILHHTGKGENTKQYRGSSDIKAAVDTAYLLKTVAKREGRIYRLRLEGFKSRFAAAQNFPLEFHSGVGFDLWGGPAKQQTHEADDVVRQILTDTPNINGKRVKELARALGLSKHKVDEALRSGPWQRTPGRGREIRFSLPEPEDQGQQPDEVAA